MPCDIDARAIVRGVVVRLVRLDDPMKTPAAVAFRATTVETVHGHIMNGTLKNGERVHVR